MQSFRKINFSFLVLLFALAANAQEQPFQQNTYGFNAGLTLAFGTHFQRAGINLNFYYVNGQFQSNSEVRLYYDFRSLGPRIPHGELVLSQGVLYGYGAKETLFNPFINPLSNQTFYSNSIGYVYNAYFNKIKTKQQTGAISVEVQDFTFILENDLLARPALDRFRTGAMIAQYQYKDQYQAAINLSMWTGKMGHKASIDDAHFFSKCYMDTSGAVYANTSHGLLSAQFRYHLGYSQTVQLNAGLDAEQIRNAVQNTVIHDLRFIPKKYNKSKNCHLPMLDTNGDLFLYKPGQKIRPAKLYLNLFTNPAIYY